MPFGQVLCCLLTSFFPLAVLILSVLGAILFGLATPTEAAAVGALGALVLAAGYRALTWDRLREAVYPDRPHLGHGLLPVHRLVAPSPRSSPISAASTWSRSSCWA